MKGGANALMANKTSPSDYSTFGEFIKIKREYLGKSIRGLAAELEMTPAYLSDIEKGNRYAPENYLTKIMEALFIIGEDIDIFYDLAGKNRNGIYTDINSYIGENQLARVALRKARDLHISDAEWQEIIDNMERK